MQNEIMVSVIVLTYNHEKYIRQALESILMQQVDFNYEILVGDDCSTDSTPQILLEYQNRYPELFCVRLRYRNIGATKNLYELLMLAQGKYVAYLEGDDYWCNAYKLKKQIDYLVEHISIIGCTHICEVVNQKGVSVKNNLKWLSSKKIFSIRDFKGYILPGQIGTLVCRNIFTDKSHDFSIIYRANPVISDRTIIFLLLLYGNIRNLQEKMGCYRMIEDGSNATYSMFTHNENVNLLQYQMTIELENYAKNEFGRCIKFYKFKIEQYCKYRIRQIIKK